MKPENLLLCSNGKVILSDFGIAKILPDIERCQSTSGTHGYMVRMIVNLSFSDPFILVFRGQKFTPRIIYMAVALIGFVQVLLCMNF